ncbi:hypothetical protein IMG5_100530 [Ichthyophthirius multifiliis]|uniref:Uncharacterized protein n=1 Tax=Ichthyophthirius multifiliis TaxID=5932 RepID=G0QSA5_ICHMU|nr:hypothetical protein IMG5_100530 [Ichthyophthirius multifiliis]EGR31903.1 hypothetical protein IMG5_100530 [Ichthyophthirius multifiliis]|eukprot:XP_004035389.1 hypothetical protein IMG5_100530 [Ichthyophthirius multifiliis]
MEQKDYPSIDKQLDSIFKFLQQNQDEKICFMITCQLHIQYKSRQYNGITFRHDSDGRFSGECFLKIKEDELIQKIKEKHLKRMGSRYIEIFFAKER